MKLPPLTEIRARATELVLLREDEKHARTRTPEQLELASRYARASLRRANAAAAESSSRDHMIAAAATLRESLALLVRAHVVLQRATSDEETAALDPADELKSACAAYGAQDDLELAVSALAATSPLHFDDLAEEELTRVVKALRATRDWLRRRVDLRSVAYVRGQRVGRIAALGLVALVLIYLAVRAALAPPNLARGKPVTMSAQAPDTAPPQVLVDGRKGGGPCANTPSRRGECVHTTRGDSWVSVDLEGGYLLEKIVIYNRGDGWLDTGLPLTVEVSRDGQTFTPIATRTTRFGSGFLEPPWTISPSKVRARAVRVRSPSLVALSEMEVYGAP